MQVNKDGTKIDELLRRGVEEIIDAKDLRARLLSGEKLRIKLGIDPTSPNIHLGRSIPLLKLRDFQELGHQVVFIVGDFTGIVGDTSDKDSERPMLEAETIKNNLKNYKSQVGKIIDLKKAEFHSNSSWLKKLGYADVGTHAEIFSINQFISRDNIAKRLKEGKRVSLREVLYPLMQGYDSVAIKADVELGGTDQKFNLLAGRDMQKYFGQTPQNIITGPLIEGLDGRKMSSSWGNTVNFLDEPNDMYGKIMSLKDDFVIKYFELLTRVPMADIESYKKRLAGGENPKNIKTILAKTIVAMYHNEKLADSASEAWEATFSQGEIPKDTKTIKVKIKAPIVDLLIKEGIVKSRGEFRRLVEEGAIRFKGSLEERKIVDPNSLADENGALRIGKKRFLKIEIIKK